MTNQRIDLVTSILKTAYPNARIVLHYSNNWELLVAVILSAQCTDKKVNEVTSRLFTKYPTLQSYIEADIAEFEQDIKPTGFYRNKAKNILAAAKLVQDKFGGELPRTMEEMLVIPGVARKTANVVLGNAYGIVEGIAVDTHVSRVSQRLRLVPLDKIGGKKPVSFTKEGKTVMDYYKDASPVKIEQQLLRVIAKKNWFSLTYLLIDHGRAVCIAQKPKCRICPVNHLCPASRI